MNTDLSATQRIEVAGANAFFAIINTNRGTNYKVTRVAGHGEVPDIQARDSDGKVFNLEITMTEDFVGDIADALGRKPPNRLQSELEKSQIIRSGKYDLPIRSFEHDALPILLKRIEQKLFKQYGDRTGLLVRDSSGLWNWEPAVPIVEEFLSSKTVPFDLGIWVMSLNRETMVLLYQPTAEE